VRHPIIAVADLETLARIDYDFEPMRALMLEHDLTTLQLIWRETPTRFRARDPFAAGGVVEDPATGAAAAALGAYLRERGEITAPATFEIAQGIEMGRPSLLTVSIVEGDPRIPRVGDRRSDRVLVLGETAQRGLDAFLERATDRRVGEGRMRGGARLRQRVAQRLERCDDLGLGSAARPDGARLHRGHACRRHLFLQLEDDPLGELLADARDRHKDGLVAGHDRELKISCRARADDGKGDLGADAVHGEQQVEEPELLAVAKP
jgi:hypothetical protein